MNGARYGVVIVIFGAAVRPNGQPSGTLAARVEAAVAFARTRHDPLFMPTGGKGRHGDAEAAVMARLLKRSGFRPDQIVAEETGTDTVSSVRAVRRLLRTLDIHQPVFVATSRYHLPRCLLLMRLAGLSARACPPPARPAASRLPRRWYWRARELPALPYDALIILGLRLLGRL